MEVIDLYVLHFRTNNPYYMFNLIRNQETQNLINDFPSAKKPRRMVDSIN